MDAKTIHAFESGDSFVMWEDDVGEEEEAEAVDAAYSRLNKRRR